MNAYRKLTLAAALVLGLAVLAPNVQAQSFDKRVRVKINVPVEVPGHVLPAGTYIFESVAMGQVTRIFSADGRHLYASLITVPEERESASTASVTVKEGPEGTPERLQAWFYPEYRTGSEFNYRKSKAS